MSVGLSCERVSGMIACTMQKPDGKGGALSQTFTARTASEAETRADAWAAVRMTVGSTVLRKLSGEWFVLRG